MPVRSERAHTRLGAEKHFCAISAGRWLPLLPPWQLTKAQSVGKCLFHWPEMAVTLGKSPAAESYWWFFNMPSPITPDHPIDSAVFSVCIIYKFNCEFIL